jgi:uncharacterized membrane protein YhiD involved in acid resistance
MTASFHADHIIGASIADLRARGAGLETVLHVCVGSLVVVMHKAPLCKDFVTLYDAKGRPEGPF